LKLLGLSGLVVNMQAIYLLIVLLPIFVEISPEFCTDGVICKLSLGLLSVGGLVAMSGNGSSLICIAIVMIYIEKLIYMLVKKLNY